MQETNPASTSFLITQVHQEREGWKGIREHLQGTAGCRATHKLKKQASFKGLPTTKLAFVHQGLAMKDSFLMQYHLLHQRQPCNIKVIIPWEQDPAGTTKFSWTSGHVGISYRWQSSRLHSEREKQYNFITCSEPLPATSVEQWHHKKAYFKALDFGQTTWNGFALHVNNPQNGSLYQQPKATYLLAWQNVLLLAIINVIRAVKSSFGLALFID